MVAEADGRSWARTSSTSASRSGASGPITIDPKGQNSGVGRRLMEAVIERGKDAPGIRLLQDGFHMRSLSLYTRSAST